jgi:hypothetical protein
MPQALHGGDMQPIVQGQKGATRQADAPRSRYAEISPNPKRGQRIPKRAAIAGRDIGIAIELLDETTG